MAVPKVVLEFACDAKYGPEKTLLNYVSEYERSATKNKKTYANEGKLYFQVQYSGSHSAGARRQESFQTRAGARRGEPELLDRALRQFRKTLRLVTIESGESLESVLEGKFREILHSVVRENLQEEFSAAESHRSDYTEGLSDKLLGPLRGRMREVLCELFPELTDVTLVPSVPSIDETLSAVSVNLRDAVETSLAAKGTGVRGGVMVAMLRYLAENSRRSMIFCVEEPEAFLHPAAQEELRDDLEALAERSDVTLLTTTHSPFVISRDPKAQVIALSKDGYGRTLATGRAAGDEPRASLLGDLFRDAALPDLLERIDRLPEEADAFLVVEGDTDEGYLRVALSKAGRADLLDGIAIIPSGGADKLVTQVLMTRQLTDRPILALLDFDEMGKSAAERLAKFGFQNNKEILSYRSIFPKGGDLTGLEAEDLWPEALHQAFVKKHGQDVLAEQKRIGTDASWLGKEGMWHFGYTKSGKDLIVEFMQRHAMQHDISNWVELMTMIRKLSGLDERSAVQPRVVATDKSHEGSTESGTPNPPSPVGDDAVIVAARVAYQEYLTYGAYVCQVGRFSNKEITRIGFYFDRAIQRELPSVRVRRDGVTFSQDELARLRTSSSPEDLEIADLVAVLLQETSRNEGEQFQVFLLTKSKDPQTLKLKHAIQNTKKSARGSGTAWTQKQRYVRSDHLALSPKTTDELDALSRND